jgi:hypothetical protein
LRGYGGLAGPIPVPQCDVMASGLAQTVFG